MISEGESVQKLQLKDDNGKLVPNEKEFVILQSMFHLRKSGLGYRKIADEVKKKF